MEPLIHSMTGFGRGERQSDKAKITVEITSLNKKQLDVRCHLPSLLSSYEVDINRKISSRCHRGFLTVTVTLVAKENPQRMVLVNHQLAQQLLQGWHEIAQSSSHIVEEKIPLSLLAQYPEVLEVMEADHVENYSEELFEALESALNALVSMRQREGLALAEDLRRHLEGLRALLNHVATITQDNVTFYRSKVQERLKTVGVTENIEAYDGLWQEISRLAERCDVSEEISRLYSHMDQYDALLKGEELPVGRKMDFLLQEMLREVQTLGNKTSDRDLSKEIVAMKVSIDRMKEQVQNVE